MTTMDGVGEEKRVGVPCLKASVWSLIGHHNGMKGGEGKREEERVRGENIESVVATTWFSTLRSEKGQSKKMESAVEW